jgi:hypothetical protein
MTEIQNLQEDNKKENTEKLIPHKHIGNIGKHE